MSGGGESEYNRARKKPTNLPQRKHASHLLLLLQTCTHISQLESHPWRTVVFFKLGWVSEILSLKLPPNIQFTGHRPPDDDDDQIFMESKTISICLVILAQRFCAPSVYLSALVGIALSYLSRLSICSLHKVRNDTK